MVRMDASIMMGIAYWRGNSLTELYALNRNISLRNTEIE